MDRYNLWDWYCPCCTTTSTSERRPFTERHRFITHFTITTGKNKHLPLAEDGCRHWACGKCLYKLFLSSLELANHVADKHSSKWDISWDFSIVMQNLLSQEALLSSYNSAQQSLLICSCQLHWERNERTEPLRIRLENEDFRPGEEEDLVLEVLQARKLRSCLCHTELTVVSPSDLEWKSGASPDAMINDAVTSPVRSSIVATLQQEGDIQSQVRQFEDLPFMDDNNNDNEDDNWLRRYVQYPCQPPDIGSPNGSLFNDENPQYEDGRDDETQEGSECIPRLPK